MGNLIQKEEDNDEEQPAMQQKSDPAGTRPTASKPWVELNDPGNVMMTLGRRRVEWSVRMGVIYCVTMLYAVSDHVADSRVFGTWPILANFYGTFAIASSVGGAVTGCVEMARGSVWKSTSASGAPDDSSLTHFSAMPRPCWLRRAVRNWHTATPSRHGVDGVEVDSTNQHERAVKFLISTQARLHDRHAARRRDGRGHSCGGLQLGAVDGTPLGYPRRALCRSDDHAYFDEI